MFTLIYSLNPLMKMWHHCCLTPSSYVQITDCAYLPACQLARSLCLQCCVDVASVLTATLMKASVEKKNNLAMLIIVEVQGLA